MNYTKMKQEQQSEEDAKHEAELNQLYLEEMENIGLKVII